jgi:hypothetical protein
LSIVGYEPVLRVDESEQCRFPHLLLWDGIRPDALTFAGASPCEAAHQRRLSQLHANSSHLQLRLSPGGYKDSQVEALEMINVACSLEDYESRL